MSTTEQQQALNEAARANVETGVLLLCKEALITAIMDRRLSRQHLGVLAVLAEHISRTTAKAWPSREVVATELRIDSKSVSNRLLELRELGYLVMARERVPEANNRSLSVYTFGKVDHETLRRCITEYVDKLKGAAIAETEQKSKVPTGRDFQKSHHVGTSTHESPYQQGTHQPEVPTRRERKSLPVGDSNSVDETHKKLAPQVGTRAPMQADLLDQVDPPLPVEVKLWKSAVAFKPLGEEKFYPITNQWIGRSVPGADLDIAREFVASEIEQFFADRPVGKDGKNIRIMGFITSGFQYRWPAFKARYQAQNGWTAPGGESDPWAEVRKQRELEASDD